MKFKRIPFQNIKIGDVLHLNTKLVYLRPLNKPPGLFDLDKFWKVIDKVGTDTCEFVTFNPEDELIVEKIEGREYYQVKNKDYIFTVNRNSVYTEKEYREITRRIEPHEAL